MIIAVEGLDGSGKTTVGRILAESVGGVYAALPPPELTLVTTTLFEDLYSDARYLYYLSGVISLAEMSRKSRILIADRFVASAHALHLHISSPLSNNLRELPLPVPDLTFYLDVDEPARIQRLQARGIGFDQFELLLSNDCAFRRRVAEKMQAYPHTFVIETTNRSPDLVARRAHQIWEEVSQNDC